MWPDLPWWTPGAALALCITAAFIGINFWLRRVMVRAAQRATADEQQWQEVANALGVDLHDHQPPRPYRGTRRAR